MKMEEDYRGGVSISLQVMKDLRHKIYKDSIEHYSGIYNGLHEFASDNTRNLYFQAYEMEWLDSHWDKLARLLQKNGYGKAEQRDLTLFFSERFSVFLTEMEDSSSPAKGAMRDLIVAQKEIIEQMIDYADKWEEQSNRLRVGIKKHREHFKRLIESSQKISK